MWIPLPGISKVFLRTILSIIGLVSGIGAIDGLHVKVQLTMWMTILNEGRTKWFSRLLGQKYWFCGRIFTPVWHSQISIKFFL